MEGLKDLIVSENRSDHHEVRLTEFLNIIKKINFADNMNNGTKHIMVKKDNKHRRTNKYFKKTKKRNHIIKKVLR